MPQSDPPAGLSQVRAEDFTDATRAFFGQWTDGIFQNADTNPVRRSFAHYPVRPMPSQLNVHLLSTNTLPVKKRQIAIMRTAWLTRRPTGGRAISTPATRRPDQ